uniref:Bm8809, isoform a n=1 Tax=Brugia malayi TaxID=6279 RepID=A0A1I9G0E0_BRUMA|nr:Bm8809, isoform a [Brugia malayi]
MDGQTQSNLFVKKSREIVKLDEQRNNIHTVSQWQTGRRVDTHARDKIKADVRTYKESVGQTYARKGKVMNRRMRTCREVTDRRTHTYGKVIDSEVLNRATVLCGDAIKSKIRTSSICQFVIRCTAASWQASRVQFCSRDGAVHRDAAQATAQYKRQRGKRPPSEFSFIPSLCRRSYPFL